MTGQPFDYVYNKGHWNRPCEHDQCSKPYRVAMTVLSFILVAAIAFAIAFLFVEGWDAQHKIDQVKAEQRAEQMMGIGGYEYGRRMPEVFADGRESTTGFGYYERRAGRGR